MAAQKITNPPQSTSTPPPVTTGQRRVSTATSTVSDVSSSSSSSAEKRHRTRRMSSVLSCFPGRRQRKSTSPTVNQQPIDKPVIILREPVEGSVLGAPIPFAMRDARPSDLDCSSLFSQQTKGGVSIPLSPAQPLPTKQTTPPASPLVPLCVDIFSSSIAATYVSPNASALCAHETVVTKVTAPRSPGKVVAAQTPIAELALEVHSEMRESHSSPQGEVSSSLNYTPTQAPAPMSPLPAYMDPLEDLEIRDNITVQARDDVASFTSLLNEKAGWKDVGSKQGVKVARKEVGHGKPALVKGTIQFKAQGATAEDVISFFWATNPMQYNDTIEASFRLRTWGEELCVFYQSYKGAMGAQGRDFVLYGTRATAEDKNRAIFVSSSCDWTKTPEMLAPRVRAQCYIGGMVCTVVSPGVLELTQIWQADLCGSLPDMVKRMVAVSSVGSLAPATRLFVKSFTG